jgi:hypothetical protein
MLLRSPKIRDFGPGFMQYPMVIAHPGHYERAISGVTKMT